MAFYTNPATKFERALRALLINQGKATYDNCFISNDSRSKILPCRVIVVRQFNPTRPYRPEGVCHAEIQHHFSAIDDQGQPVETPRVQLDNYLGDTLDTLNLGGAMNQTDMNPLADAITSAGRALAAAGGIIGTNNADMVNFRCDWVKFLSPQLTRGRDSETTNWVELVHISAFTSHASN